MITPHSFSKYTYKHIIHPIMKYLFYNFKESWMDNPRKTLLVVRFLGTTPTSSSIPTMLLSICQQICYNMEVRTTTRILPIQKKTLDSIEWLMSIILYYFKQRVFFEFDIRGLKNTSLLVPNSKRTCWIVM